MTTITLQRPAAGQTLTFAPQAENGLVFDFNSNEATLTREGEALSITFDDGATIALEGFYEVFTASSLPELQVEGQAVDAAQFFANLGEELMPASGISTSAAMSSGSTVQSVTGTLLEGIDSLTGIEQTGTTPIATPVTSIPHAPTTTMFVAETTRPTRTITENTPPTSANPEVTPEIEAEAQFFAQGDVLAADQGSRLSGNLLANDTLPEGVVLNSITAPADWAASQNADGSITYVYDYDAQTTLTVHANGDYVLTTNIENLGISNFTFGYEAVDPSGNTYTADIIIGNADAIALDIETLEGNSAIITTGSGNSYVHEFTNYSSDSEVGNQHVNGMLLGAGDDTINVENAIGSQTNPHYAGVNDTFIYGDSLRNEDPNSVGNDEINVTNLDGTKIRADGNLYNGVEGGDDTVNVENMEGGSIIGDGWNLYTGSNAGDDLINVGTINSGEIYGDGVLISGGVQGGNDTINIDTIDTTAQGRQDVIVNGGIGDDVISVGSLETASGDVVKIDGGLGIDTFDYDSDADDTMALLGNNVYIAGESSQITNFEGVSTGAGDDLIKFYDRADNELDFDNLFADAGEGMDVILGNLTNFDEISSLVESDKIENAEVIVFSNDLNNANTKSTDDLFGKLENEGVEKNEDGSISFDNSWTQGDSVGEYDSYTNQEQDITILVARTQMENTLV